MTGVPVNNKWVTNYTENFYDNLLLNIRNWSSLLPWKCKAEKEKQTIKKNPPTTWKSEKDRNRQDR